MLKTPFGPIKITIDGIDVPYTHKKLKTLLIGNHGLPVYNVDGRYQIVVTLENLSKPLVVHCRFGDSETAYSGGIHSGERLALKTWEKDNLMFSIGTEDEIKDTFTGYSGNGVIVQLLKQCLVDRVIFNIAWKLLKDPCMEDVYTWFAADPTYGLQE